MEENTYLPLLLGFTITTLAKGFPLDGKVFPLVSRWGALASSIHMHQSGWHQVAALLTAPRDAAAARCAITDTEDRLIAAAAIIGESRMPKAG